jgi:hypothetical protein
MWADKTFTEVTRALTLYLVMFSKKIISMAYLHVYLSKFFHITFLTFFFMAYFFKQFKLFLKIIAISVAS